MASALLMVLALQATETGGLPVSLDRVRAGLERTPGLTLTVTEPTPHFRIIVHERRLFPDLPPIDFGDGVRRPAAPFWMATAPQIGTTPPLAAVDVMALASRLSNAIGSARRARAERNAREEVERALREFCATTRECEIR